MRHFRLNLYGLLGNENFFFEGSFGWGSSLGSRPRGSSCLKYTLHRARGSRDFHYFGVNPPLKTSHSNSKLVRLLTYFSIE
jgi:hypothetical protein